VFCYCLHIKKMFILVKKSLKNELQWNCKKLKKLKKVENFRRLTKKLQLQIDLGRVGGWMNGLMDLKPCWGLLTAIKNLLNVVDYWKNYESCRMWLNSIKFIPRHTDGGMDGHKSVFRDKKIKITFYLTIILKSC
jgi:hypothetical protein